VAEGNIRVTEPVEKGGGRSQLGARS
jgi:hypothetical protein